MPTLISARRIGTSPAGGDGVARGRQVRRQCLGEDV